MRVTVKQMQEKAQRELAEVSDQVRQDRGIFRHPTCRAPVLQHEMREATFASNMSIIAGY